MRHLILIALLFIATLNAIENKKITLQLSWLNQFQFAGYYIAIEKGYYKEVGIDLTIKEFSNDTNLIKDIENKKVDFAIGRSSLIIDKSEGKDIVALAAIFQKSPLMLLTLKRDDIKQLSDLKHKNIMITSDAKSTASIMAMLNSKNILKDDINIQKHTFNLDDLINGKADAMASYVSNEPIKLKDKDIKYQIFHPKDYSFDLYSDILFTSSSFIKSNPKLTKDFYEASMKGWRYAFENIVESAQIIHTKYNTQNKTLLSYIKEGEILKDLVYHQGSQEIGCLDEDKLTKIVNIYKVMGFIKNDFDIKQFIYKHNTHKKIKFELAHKEIYLVLILSILLVLLIVVFVLYLSIKKRWLLTTTELQNEIEHQKTILEKQNKFIISQSRITAASEILENIAHQWRQPLSIVTTNMSSLKFSIEMDEEISKESLNTLANSVIKQSNYLSGIIDDFSSYFNNIDSSIEIYNVDDLLVQIENSYSYKFNENFVQYIKDIDDTCKIKINKSLFIQSLLVLYTNSIDAFKKNNIPHNGRYFFVKVINKSDNIIIKIKDSAGGLDDDCIEKIFEPYFTTKHKSIGTGIGLYMTHQIVTKQFHGTIKNENKVFEYDKKTLKGTEFIITLPL